MAADNAPAGQDYLLEQRSHLFTVRVWHEAINDVQAEWRGRVQHVSTGQVYYFRDWDMLITYLVSMLPAIALTGQEMAGEQQGRNVPETGSPGH